MGGKPKAQTAQENLARDQSQVMREQLDFSKQRTAQMDKLQAPGIDFYSKLASGDKNAQATALAPTISKVGMAFDQSRKNIFDQLTPGAGREFALGNLERDKANTMAGVLPQAHLGAFDTLLKLGGAQGDFGLQQLGAGMRAGEAAGNTNNSVLQAETQRKASQLGLIGSLAGAAGMATGAKFPR